MKTTALFLDIDDVLCLNQTCTGWSVVKALGEVQVGTAKVADFPNLWKEIFDADAVAHLQRLDAAFSITYVISSSWKGVMNRAAIATTFRQTGLGFIADKMHPIWETPNQQETRSFEISLWLQSNPEFKNRWVILDDEYSGTGLDHWPHEDEQQFIHLCIPGIGLGQSGYEQLQQAFALRAKNGEYQQALNDRVFKSNTV